MSNEGKLVKIDYVGTLSDGTVFDSSLDKGEPVEFVCMDLTMLPGLERAVRDMEVGETKRIHIPCINAYGEYHEKMIQYIPISQIPNGESLPVGRVINLTGMDGKVEMVSVLSIDNGIAKMDFNHPLAGKDLFFEVKLLEVSENPEKRES